MCNITSPCFSSSHGSISLLSSNLTSSGSGSRDLGSSLKPSTSGRGGAMWVTGCAPTSPSPTPSSTTASRRTRRRAGGRRHWWARPSLREWWGQSRSPRVLAVMAASATATIKTSVMTGLDEDFYTRCIFTTYFCQAPNCSGDRVSRLPPALQGWREVQRLQGRRPRGVSRC